MITLHCPLCGAPIECRIPTAPIPAWAHHLCSRLHDRSKYQPYMTTALVSASVIFRLTRLSPTTVELILCDTLPFELTPEEFDNAVPQ